MLAQGGGSIVNVASRLGQMGVAETAAYSAAKAGLIGLTRSLAKEFGSRGIRINAVAPFVTITDMTTDLVDSEEGKRRLRDMPLWALRHAPTRSPTRCCFLLSDRVGAVHRPDAQPQRRGVHAVTPSSSAFARRSGWCRDGPTFVVGGSGAGHALPQRFIDELAAGLRGRPATRAISARCM